MNIRNPVSRKELPMMRVPLVTPLTMILAAMGPTVAYAQDAQPPATVPSAAPPAQVEPQPAQPSPPAPAAPTTSTAPPPQYPSAPQYTPAPEYPPPPQYPPSPPPGYAPQPPAYQHPAPPAVRYAPQPRRGRRHRHREPAYVSGQPLAPGMRPPPRYRYIEGTPLPEGYHIEERANRGLVGSGAALVAVPYLIGAFGALSVQGDGSSGYLAIPVLGPWLTLGSRQSSCGEIGEPSPGGFNCFMDRAGTGLLIASGVMQGLGAGLIALGLVNTREYAVADYATVRFTPVATPSSGGFVLSGTM